MASGANVMLCGICWDEFKDPRALPCLHSYCLTCIDTLIEKSPAGLRCPECRQKCVIPKGGAGQFPKNFFLNCAKDTSSGIPANEGILKCECHANQSINWCCKTCDLPACSECVLEGHKGHYVEKLPVVAASLKRDLQDIAKLTAKRGQFLEKISAELRLNRIEMEREMDQVSQDLANTAQDMCRQVMEREHKLQAEIQQAREAARIHFSQAEEEITRRREMLSRLEVRTEKLCVTASKFDLPIVLQAPVIKQEFNEHQRNPVQSVAWEMKNQSLLSPAQNFLWEFGYKSTNRTRCAFPEMKEGSINFVRTIKLEYIHGYAVSGIALLGPDRMCVAHHGEKYIWVYSGEHLVKTIHIPEVETISGMVAIDGSVGKIAIVDGTHSSVFFVILTKDLNIERCVQKCVPIVPFRISMRSQSDDLVISKTDENRFYSFRPGFGQREVVVAITEDNFLLHSIAATTSGYVICDKENKKVHFTDADGHIRRMSTKCKNPWHAVQTSWGHVLIVDEDDDDIKVFSGAGDFLGSLENNIIQYPHFIHLEEAGRLLFVCCGDPGRQSIHVYNFEPSELPMLPINCSLKKMTTTLHLTEPNVGNIGELKGRHTQDQSPSNMTRVVPPLVEPRFTFKVKGKRGKHGAVLE